MPNFAKKLKFVEKSPLKKLAVLLEAARRNPNIISFGAGAPSVPPPKEVFEEINVQFKKNSWATTTYTDTRGRGELLDAISRDLKKYGEVDANPRNEIIITDGATEGILLALMAVTNQGDEVIITDPSYMGYSETISVLGGRAVSLPVYVEDGFQPEIEKLESLITNRTRAFILLSPDNPTGRVIEKKRAKAIVDLAVDHDFWILSDESYKHILYEGEHIWVGELPGARDRTITFDSFSKAASIPGLRLGYAYGPSEVIEAMEKLKQYTSLAPNTLSQLMMIKFLSGGIKDRFLHEVVIPTYRERRDAMGKFIAKYIPKAKTVKPNGAFYYFINIKDYLGPLGMNDEQLAENLVNKSGVVVIPGIHFGANGRQHFRLTFVTEPVNRIEVGVKKIGDFLAKKKRV